MAYQDFNLSTTDVLDQLIVVGAVLHTSGNLTAFLASTPQKPVAAHSPKVVATKNFSRGWQTSPVGKVIHHPSLVTTDIHMYKITKTNSLHHYIKLFLHHSPKLV